MNQNYSNIPLGITPPNATFAQPLSSKDWEGRKEMLRELGFKEDGLMMRGTEWRRGLAQSREKFRTDTADSISRALGFKGADGAALTSAAKAGGASGLMSSL